jgi:Uma2 family endonuclease
MSTTTRFTFEEFEKLPEQEGIHYELDEGELLMEPSPTYFHNVIRYRIAQRLRVCRCPQAWPCDRGNGFSAFA